MSYNLHRTERREREKNTSALLVYSALIVIK